MTKSTGQRRWRAATGSRRCHDCGDSFPVQAMVGIGMGTGAEADYVCLGCFEVRVKRVGRTLRRAMASITLREEV